MPSLELGEGARWLAEGPLQVDLLSGRVLAHRDGRVDVVLELPVPVGAVAARRGGGLAVVAGTGVRLFADLTDPVPAVVDTGVDPDTLRVNDGATDAHGRLWFGLMPYDGAPGAGSLWRLDPDGHLSMVLPGITVPNGPVIDDAREALYLADSPRGVIYRHGLDADTGRLGPAEVFATVSDGSPDGMAVDADGDLWSALWGGSRLHRYRADGVLSDVVPLPATQPTSLALDPRGGPALVTTARFGLRDPSDVDGCSLWVDLGVSGMTPHAFAG